jgi:hypothetical protein
MAEQSGILKAETSATSSRYVSLAKKIEPADPELLNKTVFKLMDRNVT